MFKRLKNKRFEVRVSESERVAWERAARRYVRTVSEWLRMVANAATQRKKGKG